MRRVGVYVDASNIGMNGGHGMRYDVLRTLACRDGGEAQRLNVYLAFDERRAAQSPDYASKAYSYQAALRDQGFRVTVKTVKHYRDEDGVETLKSNTDLEMAVDALTESERLDTVLLVSGDGDFMQVVKALQSRGCRVEVLAFDNVSRELRDAADQYINGYLIPNLLPIRDSAPGQPRWGQIGGRARGLCNRFGPDEGYGFIAFWPTLPDSQILAAAETKPVYFKANAIQDGAVTAKLPSRQIVLEFDLSPSAKPDGAPEARRIQVVSGL